MGAFEPAPEKECEHALTQRELEALCLVCSGLSGKQVGARLGIEPETARFHMSTVRQKLGAETTGEACTRAALRGIIRDCPSP